MRQDKGIKNTRILLIVGGGIAAYKALDLTRRLRERGASVRCVLTKAAQEFITLLSAGAISGERVFTDLFDPQSEFDVGHIRLARECEGKRCCRFCSRQKYFRRSIPVYRLATCSA